MSYCRFSTNGFRCDVYVFADINGGWTTHVSGSRAEPFIGPKSNDLINHSMELCDDILITLANSPE